MTPLKTWFLLHLSVLFIAPTVTEVVKSMTDCGGFLFNNTPREVPDVLENNIIQDKGRYKVICQTYNNRRRFVTLYDTSNKIPVLSAYKFTGAETGRPDDIWKIEPQLENENDDKNMKNSQSVEYNNQASRIDYLLSQYDRGHLLPSSYAKTQDDKISTFTLTNAVPQVPSFNQGSWKKMEQRVKRIMEKNCTNNNNVIEAYVMIGAKPSDNKTINNRVNVPSLLWLAFCCYSNNQNKWITRAYWGDNVPNQSGNIMLATLGQLSNKLETGRKRKRGRGSKSFKAFPGSNCPLNQTLNPLMDNNCKCV